MKIPRLRRWLAAFRAEPLFKAGVFLIPFENFFFAPSRGWGAIAPLVFLLYCIVNVRALGSSVRRLRGVLGFVAALVGLTSLNYLHAPPDPAILFDAVRSLGLGIAFLVALDLYFHARARPPGHVIRLLVAAYCLSMLLGLVQLIVINAELTGVRDVLIELSKRTTLRQPRVQFTFTEPAFLSMHVFGVLLPLLVVFRGHRAAWRLRWTLLAFVALAWLCQPSVRFMLDTAVVLVLWLTIRFSLRSRRNLWLTAGGLALLGAMFAAAWQASPRVRAIVRGGVYGDNSLAERWFLVNASAIGHAAQPLHAITGYGLSNCWRPFRAGYEQARAEYRGTNVAPIDWLGRNEPTNVQNLPLRLVSEFGLLGALAIFLLLFERRALFLFLVTVYVYLPFDSYAFYTVWLYVFFVKVKPR
jgi:hypothetical protein